MEENPKYGQKLDDLAFEGRNKSYGSYYLRKKYFKYVFISLCISIVIFSLIFFIPLIVYYLHASHLQFSDDALYSVTYTFIPSPEDDQAELARLLVRPEQETNLQPVVVDSIPVPENKIVEEVVPVEEEPENAQTDSTGKTGVSGTDGSGTGNDSDIYTIIDEFPKFPGGDKMRLYYLQKNTKYPESAMKNGINGVVKLVMIIEKDGSISNVKIVKGIGGECDEEAIRVVSSMPRWEPGKRSGRPVRVMVCMPIVFQMTGKYKK